MQKKDRFFEGHHVRRCAIFLLQNKWRPKKKKKRPQNDVQFSAQKTRKDQKKKKSSRPQNDVHFLPKNKWRPKKRSSRLQAVFCFVTFQNFL